jgi:hypothetical protein
MRFWDALYCKAAYTPLVSDAIHNKNRMGRATMDTGSTPHPAEQPKPALAKYRTAVDFRALLSDLSSSGYRLDAIAMHANLPCYLLRDYQCSARAMPHEHGERLVEFWVEVSGKPRELAPRVIRPPRPVERPR